MSITYNICSVLCHSIDDSVTKLCLTGLTSIAGKKLSDLERVTSLKVYNWFANRRKEIKRRANIGNVGLG